MSFLRRRYFWFSLVFALSLCGARMTLHAATGLQAPRGSQPPQPAPPAQPLPAAIQSEAYVEQERRVEVKDEFSRNLGAGGSLAYFAVRLAPGDAQNPAMKEGTAVVGERVSYQIGQEEWRKFQLKDGSATAVFLAPNDPADESKSLKYEITALVRDASTNREVAVKLNRSTIDISRAGSGLVRMSAPAYKAPLQTWEWLLFIGFAALAVLLVYFFFFRVYFSRLLFNRRWPVSQAENWSNGISVLMVVLLIPTLLVLFLSPDWVTGMYLTSCLLAMGAYLAVLLASFTIATVVTRKK